MNIGEENIKRTLIAFLFLLSLPVFPAQAKTAEMQPLQFVKLYIEQLGAIQKIADKAEADLEARGKAEALSNCIETMAEYQSKLAQQISVMQEVRLKEAYRFLPKSLVDYDQQKVELYKQYGQNCSTIKQGPKPDIDYNAVKQDLSKLGDQLNDIDEGIFKTAPAAFATLIQTKKNSRGEADHLSLTKAEKAALIQKMKELFGARLGRHDQNYIISAASVVDFYLEKKGFKCADEPWE